VGGRPDGDKGQRTAKSQILVTHVTMVMTAIPEDRIGSSCDIPAISLVFRRPVTRQTHPGSLGPLLMLVAYSFSSCLFSLQTHGRALACGSCLHPSMVCVCLYRSFFTKSPFG